MVNMTEGAAYGAALLAGVGAGRYPSVEAACAMTITVTGHTTPDAEHADAYRRVYPIYRGLYPALISSFNQMGQ